MVDLLDDSLLLYMVQFAAIGMFDSEWDSAGFEESWLGIRESVSEEKCMSFQQNVETFWLE